jgi:hypothetical protein
MYQEIEKPCPSCGMRNVWICSVRDCPMREGQKTTRDRWQEARNNPPEEEQKQ